MKPSKIFSVAPLMNSDPPSMHIEFACALCGERDLIVLTLEEADDFLEQQGEIYLICGNHRRPKSN